MTIAQILRAAAWRIEALGWRQYAAGDESGPNCAVGALRNVGATWLQSVDASKALLRYLGLPTQASDAQNAYAIAGWNDKMTRTKEDVVAALRGAADAHERGEIQ